MSAPERRPKLLLWGFMGVGKSTVGRRVAERLEVPFIDLDVAIEQRSGATIPELFADGEATFRAAEAETLRAVLTNEGVAVVALGGGALLDDSLRQHASEEALVVCLSAALETILRRTAGSDRPLLQGEDRAERARLLLDSRASAYGSVHASVRTDARTIDEVVSELLSIWHPDPP